MLLKVTIIASIFAATLGAQKPARRITVGLSSVPLWPQDGNTSTLPEGHYVFYDPPSGEYVVYYAPAAADSTPEAPAVLRFGSHALSDPTATVVVNANGLTFDYAYSIENGVRARQPIQEITMLIESGGTTEASHPSWTIHRGNSKVQDITAPRSDLRAIEWSSNKAAQTIGPGSTLGGFVVHSSLLPGFTTMIFRGNSQTQQYSPDAVASLPREVRDQIELVFAGGWDVKTRMVIGPKFSRGAPQSEIAQNFLLGIHRLITDGRLDSNSPFIQNVVGVLSARLESLESGNTIAIDRSSIAFDKAAPGMETTIANSLQASLAQ